MTYDDTARFHLLPHFEVLAVDAERVLIRAPELGVRLALEGVPADAVAALLRRLDGTETVGVLRTRLPEGVALDALLRQLVEREIVRAGVRRAVSAADARYFAHSHEDPDACRARLRASVVTVVGEPLLAGVVSDSLQAGGVGQVGRRLEEEGSASALVLACLSAPADPLASAVRTEADSRGVPWLPVLLFGATGFVGPLFLPGEGPCYTCLTLREQANWADPELTSAYYRRLHEHDATSLAHYGALPAFHAVLGAWAVLESTRYLAGFAAPLLLGSLLRIDFQRAAQQVHRIVRLPRCSGCSPTVRVPEVDAERFAGDAS